MKIGIVTFYRVPNYGAMLQAYSLWQSLKRMGHEVVFISHPKLFSRREPFWRIFVSRSFKGMRMKLKRYVRLPMTDFAAGYPQTILCQTMDDVCTATVNCDAFIVGSDQMWNPMWCAGEFLPLVMLDFAPAGKRRIAYATSFATKTWNENQNRKLAGTLIRKLDYISVREASGLKMVETYFGRDDVQCLLDPTLLFSVDFYSEIAYANRKEGTSSRSSTIFCYLLDEWDDNTSSMRALTHLRAALGNPKVETDRVPVAGFLGMLCWLLGVDAKISVAAWLEKIKKADFVFTNSFHGTVFALVFHKPFVTILLQGEMSVMNERIFGLLKLVGLEGRGVYAANLNGIAEVAAQDIDWADVDSRLAVERVKSLRWLVNALK